MNFLGFISSETGGTGATTSTIAFTPGQVVNPHPDNLYGSYTITVYNNDTVIFKAEYTKSISDGLTWIQYLNNDNNVVITWIDTLKINYVGLASNLSVRII